MAVLLPTKNPIIPPACEVFNKSGDIVKAGEILDQAAAKFKLGR
jgi:hypothetical protein